MNQKTKEATTWIKTDTLQWVKKTDENSFSVIDTYVWDGDRLIVGHFSIDVRNYTDAQIQEELSPFGHRWTTDWRESCGPNEAWKQIVAECIAENMMPDEGEEMSRAQYINFLKHEEVDVTGIRLYLMELE